MLYELIEIRGSDADQFLQGQLTQDVAALDAAISLPAAWCNAKGRVITLVRLLALANSIGLVVPATLGDAVMQRLTMYRLRADVNIERSDEEWACVAVSTAAAFEQLDGTGLLPAANAACTAHGLIAVDYSMADRFVEIFGHRHAFSEAGLKIDSGVTDDVHLALKIRAGIAEITAANTEKYTPHMLNLDRLGAISFDKGCYIGQEVVARTEHLGESKRRVQRYRCDAADVAIGDKVADGERDVGTVVNVQGAELLAVTPVALHDRPLAVKGATAEPLP